MDNYTSNLGRLIVITYNPHAMFVTEDSMFDTVDVTIGDIYTTYFSKYFLYWFGLEWVIEETLDNLYGSSLWFLP